MLIALAGFCGALTQSQIKSWSRLNGHRSLPGKLLNWTSLSIVVAALAELLIVRYLFRHGLELIQLAVLQEMSYFLWIVILAVFVHGERLNLALCAGIGAALVSVILISTAGIVH